MSKLLHDNNDAKAIAIPQVFSENSRAKKRKRTLIFSILLFIYTDSYIYSIKETF